MKFDLHTHSVYSSDAFTKPETMLKVAQKKNIGFAITDHDSTMAWHELKGLNRKYNVPIIFGQEVSAIDDKGKHAAHILGLFLTEELKSTNYLEVLDEINSQGAVSVIAHPFDVFRGKCKCLDEIKHKADLAEVFNSRCYLKSFNKKAEAFARENHLGFSAGSDGHFPEELGMAWADYDTDSSDELQKALLKGKVSTGGRLSGLIPHAKTQLRLLGFLAEM